MANFPSTIVSFTDPSSGNFLNSPPHATQHATENDEIVAVQTKVGADNSADTTSLDYKLSGIVAGEKAIGTTQTQIATPTAPASGKNKLYFKSDDSLYRQNSAGDEEIVGGFPSGVSVYLSVDQSVANGTPVKITFNTAVYDLNSEFDLVANHRFTAKTAGKYLVTFTVVTQIVANQAVQAAIYVNGVSKYTMTNHTSNTNGISSQATAIINMALNDYIEFYGIQTDSAPKNFTGGASNGCFAQIQRLL